MIRMLALLLLCTATRVAAQFEGIEFTNRIYKENIYSVKFHIDGLFLTYPMYDINSSTQLRLSFDDLSRDVNDYAFTVIHCDRNWRPSQLSEMEYIDGYSEGLISTYHFSFKTLTPFTHYDLWLPNEDMTLTKTGNYLLVVFEDNRQKTPVITRRFTVVDNRVIVAPKVVNPVQVSKMRSHQEIDFIVDFEKFPMRSPQQEVKAVVLQNGRWDNAIMDLSPMFVQRTTMSFDHQNKIVFPAGKEFRYLDLRSFKYGSENIAAIDRLEDRYEVTLLVDQSLAQTPYFNREDLNGNFVIESRDQNGNFDLVSDYGEVLFSYENSDSNIDYDLYLVGEMTDWRLQDRYRLIYNPATSAFVTRIRLKQGFYNYAYAAVPKNSKKAAVDLSIAEGNSYEADNNYTILIYYSPLGGRYDEIIGFINFRSSI